MLSAVILFSGSIPTKVLHFLKCLRVASITDRTFYLHQTQYLETSVLSVWRAKQQQLISTCKLPLTIGGDGGADSPGHSAKYGSYGIIDLRTTEVLHIELVTSLMHKNCKILQSSLVNREYLLQDNLHMNIQSYSIQLVEIKPFKINKESGKYLSQVI